MPGHRLGQRAPTAGQACPELCAGVENLQPCTCACVNYGEREDTQVGELAWDGDITALRIMNLSHLIYKKKKKKGFLRLKIQLFNNCIKLNSSHKLLLGAQLCARQSLVGEDRGRHRLPL